MILANTLEKGGSAGFLALLLVVLLFIVTVLLVRNMSGRLKRLPKEFAPPADDSAPPVTPSPDGPSSPRT
ncbi:MAG: hypothetical protein JWM64_1589 [Frankiales bacterium]|nr:hypothetical protein [Frankiales bacterium]